MERNGDTVELFCVKPAVHYFESFHAFAEEFALAETDLILTERVIYDSALAGEKVLRPHVLLKDDYDPAEPREEAVDAILKDMEGLPVERVIAVGGGSVIDIAKLLCVRDAYPIGGIIRRERDIRLDKTLVAVPTTCGTGSEVTYGGVVTMRDTGYKTALIDPVLAAGHAVLIPELLYSLPDKVFLHCAADALGHAMESYVSRTRGNEMARAAGARAVKLITEGCAGWLLAGGGREARNRLTGRFLMASCLGGMAVNNGGAGPVHALAYPVGEVYHMSHGESIYQFLSEVFLHYERTADGPPLAELRDIIRPALAQAGIRASSVFQGLEELMNAVCPPRPLGACGMTEDDVEGFVENIFAAKQRLLATSFTEFTRRDAADIYRRRLGGHQ